MRSDTGLYVLATVVLLLGLGSRLHEAKVFQTASQWTGGIADRIVVKLSGAPVFVAGPHEVNRNIELADLAVQRQTACVNARIARQQAHMAQVRARLARAWASKSVRVDVLCSDQ